jgi:hypothetical protein
MKIFFSNRTAEELGQLSGIELAYRLDNWGVGVLAGPVQTGSVAHPASYPMGTRGSFPGGKAARA